MSPMQVKRPLKIGCSSQTAGGNDAAANHANHTAMHAYQSPRYLLTRRGPAMAPMMETKKA